MLAFCPVRKWSLRIIYFILFSYSTASIKAQVDTESVLTLGRNAIYIDDYITAIHYFNQAIEAKPYLAKAYYYRAYAKFSLEDYHGAELDCSKSLELNPFITHRLPRLRIRPAEPYVEDHPRCHIHHPHRRLRAHRHQRRPAVCVRARCLAMAAKSQNHRIPR